MTSVNVKKMTLDELVARFAAIALAQDKAIFDDDNAEFNRLYQQMDLIRNELKSRTGDQRKALLPLYNHPNLQVRLKAAITTLAVAPEPARRMLQSIFDSRRLPQSADAGFILHGLDDGSFVPS